MSSTVNANPAADTTAWYAMAVDAAVERLATDTGKGLDAAEAANRLQKYGPNRLPEGKKRGPFMRFLSQFNNILVYVLLGAGFTKLMLNLWVDAAIIFSVVVGCGCSRGPRQQVPEAYLPHHRVHRSTYPRLGHSAD
jgi:magnesium-transporting ATPase (P-type)